MDPLVVGFIGIGVFLVLLAAGVHIAVALGAVGLAGLIYFVGFGPALSILINACFYKVYNIMFLVLILFITVGVLAAAGGISSDTYRALSLWLNKIRGGLAIATVASCTAFGTVCGSSLVTAAVFAKASVPEMRQYGYDKRLSYGLVAAAGNIGMLIPPSVLIIFYAILTEESPGKLLIAGLTPGLMLFVVFSIGILVMGRLKPDLLGSSHTIKTTWRERFVSLRLLWPIILVATILVVGVATGILAVGEAGAAGVLVIFFVVLFTRRSWKVISSGLADSAAIAAMIFFIFISAGVFSRFLAFSGVAPALIEWLLSLELSHLGVVIAMSIVYLIMGCFLDAISMLAITSPIIYPAVQMMGIDPIWYAMSIILAIHIGLITPPVGLNVYGVKGVAEADVSLEDIFIGALPFFVLSLIALVFIIAFPQLSTFFPSFMTL